jgi:hypothetical protein
LKKLFIILVLLTSITLLEAKRFRKTGKSLIEIGPKASLYISSVEFGIGAEMTLNPIRTFGFRLDVTEVKFGSTTFYLNHGTSLDALIYIPMRDIEPYIHTGFGFTVFDTPTGTQTFFSIRAGMGFNYPIARRSNLFVEPGIIISGDGDTKATFRLSFGGRFGILR